MNQTEEPPATAPDQEVAADSREAWLEVAATDPDCGALATAARHGRPLPPLQAE